VSDFCIRFFLALYPIGRIIQIIPVYPKTRALKPDQDMNEPVKLGKPDARGNYKRDLGWKVQDGQYVQHRFYVVKDRTTAMRRVERLEHLWDALEAAWNEQRQSGVRSPLHLGDERPVWNTFTLVVAMAVARGDAEVEIDPAADEDFAHALLSPVGLTDWFGKRSALVP